MRASLHIAGSILTRWTLALGLLRADFDIALQRQHLVNPQFQHHVNPKFQHHINARYARMKSGVANIQQVVLKNVLVGLVALCPGRLRGHTCQNKRCTYDDEQRYCKQGLYVSDILQPFLPA